MAARLTLKTTHPALLVTPGHSTPSTPTSPFNVSYPKAPTPPVHSYAQLRAHHVSALKYVIAKLRWEQMNNGYLRGEDAWLGHNRIIGKLEAELEGAEAAQKGLDRFPNCFAATANPKPHGPLTKEQFEAEKKAEEDKVKMINDRLDAQFPFLKQLFIGPRTKQQARHDKLLRELMADGDFEDLSVLLPSENLRLLQEGEWRKTPKKPYQVQRLEREKKLLAKAKADKKADVAPKADKVVKVAYGPKAYEEHLASLPKYGPLTRGQALLPAQREQRHILLSWLRRPWPEYDEDAGELLQRLGRLALKKMEAEVMARKTEAETMSRKVKV